MSAERDAPGVVAPPPLIYAGGLAVGLGLDAALPSASLPRLLRTSLGWVLVVAGVVLLASFLAAFRRARTPVDPREATTTVVTSGPYRLSRNPAYLGMTLIYAGIAILSEALWAFVALAVTLVVVDRGVIAREERYLEGKFGAEYRRYKARTRRWL